MQAGRFLSSHIIKDHRHSRAQLAEKVGVSVTAVSSWEQGKRQPGRASLIKLSEVLGCTVDELLR